ncbi:Pantothenate synthetase [Bienertia sinuspersici]
MELMVNQHKIQEVDGSKNIIEEVLISSVKDDALLPLHVDASGSILESVSGDKTNKKENDDDVSCKKSSDHTPSPQDVGADGSYSSIDQSAPIPHVTTPEYVQENTLEKVKEYVDFEEEEEEKKEVEERNDGEEVVGSKRESMPVVKEEQHIPDINEGDSFPAKSEDSTIRQPGSSERNETYTPLLVTNCDIIVSRTLRQQRNKYMDELSLKERVLVDFLFYSKYEDVSRLSIDEYESIVRAHNADLRYNLECSVLLEIVNLVSPEIPVYMSKTDFLSLAPQTWLTRGSIVACSYMFNRREEEKPGNPRRF